MVGFMLMTPGRHLIQERTSPDQGLKARLFLERYSGHHYIIELKEPGRYQQTIYTSEVLTGDVKKASAELVWEEKPLRLYLVVDGEERFKYTVAP